MQPTTRPPIDHTVIVMLPGKRRIVGRVIALSMLGPGSVNITIETAEVVLNGEYQAIYKTPSQESFGIFKVFRHDPYRNRWRASGILGRPKSQLRFLLIPT